MKGVRLVPYSLPEVIKAETVFIVEGEKDANTLSYLSLVGTTNVGGALKWRDEYRVYFKGKHVVIIPDNDDVGREHGQQVAASLFGMAASIKVVELPGLPEKGDLSDFVGSNYQSKKEELLKLVEGTSCWEPPAKQETRTHEHPIREITPGMAFCGDTAYLAIKYKGNSCVVTSSRDILSLDDLVKSNLFPLRHPNPEQRWSYESINGFIKNRTLVEPLKLFNRLKNIFQHYIDFQDKRQYELMPLWVMGTYFHRIFSSYPYLHLSGNIQSGKTKSLTLQSLLSFNGELTCNSTPAYIIRVIHENHSACCVDEAEKLRVSKDENSLTILSMYNSGYKQGAFVGKVESTGKDKGWVPKKFDAYSPKAFASIRELDQTLHSRCIPITMVESANDEIKNREIDLLDATIQDIRDELYIFTLSYFKEVREAYQQLSDNVIVGREWELWKPLLAVCTVLDTETGEPLLYNDIRELAIATIKEKNFESENNTPQLILSGLYELLGEKGENFYTPAELLLFLQENVEGLGWLKIPNHKTFIGKELKKLGLVNGAEREQSAGRRSRGYRLNIIRIKERMVAMGMKVNMEEDHTPYTTVATPSTVATEANI